MNNPLLDFKDLALFDQVRPEHVVPAMDTLLVAADKALAEVTQPEFPARWDDISKVLETATEELGRAWSVVSHLNGVADTPNSINETRWNCGRPAAAPRPRLRTS